MSGLIKKLEERSRKLRFSGLLAAILLAMVISPSITVLRSQLGRTAATVLFTAAYSIMLMMAALAVSRTRRQSQVICGLMTLALLAIMVDAVWMTAGTMLLRQGVSLVFLIVVVVLIVRFLFHQRDVTLDTISASLCGYLAMAVAFSLAYEMLLEWNPRSLQANTTLVADATNRSQLVSLAIYFSMVTITTLGYGDVTPVSVTARTLVMLEAFLGQVYLVVLVARLVGLHISQQMMRQARTDEAATRGSTTLQEGNRDA